MYTVGKSLASGLPCIIYDGDSVLCEFPNAPRGEEQAKAVCDALNFVRVLRDDPTGWALETHC